MDVHHPIVKYKNQELIIGQNFMIEHRVNPQISTHLSTQYLPSSLPINNHILIDMSVSIGSAQHFIFLKNYFLNFVKYKKFKSIKLKNLSKSQNKKYGSIDMKQKSELLIF